MIIQVSDESESERSSLIGRSRSLTAQQGNESLVYPQRIGPGHITAHRALRIRFLLKHPEHVRGRRDLMHALTGHADEGVEFVEQWQVWRAASLVLLLAFLSMVIAIATSIKLNDWSTGFSIGSKLQLTSSFNPHSLIADRA